VKRLLIVGAGEAGSLLLRDIKKNSFSVYQVIGFADDYKEGELDNVPILGKTENVPKIVQLNKIEEIVIAIPSLNGERLKELVALCKKTGVETKILPGTYEGTYTFKTGRPWYNPVREIKMEDLLRRKPTLIDLSEIEGYILKKNILISGGGGSIGRELCKQVAELNPESIIILDNCEYNLYDIDYELREKYPEGITIKSIIGDVKDTESIRKIFLENKIDVIFHAAAYKHVPLMESNIKEAIKNNIFGTYNIASLASEFGVKNFVLISTDKAVNPTSIMGATKRIAEMAIHLFEGNTRFVTVRFGNVLGSKGSVIPLFEKQIRSGGPVTITHPEITRYFMTIPEAVQLVIQAGTIGNNKEILVLDMGQPHKVVDIAKELIRLYGLEPDKDIQIKFIGLRPGEKLYEELLTIQEGLSKTKNERIFISKKENINENKLQIFLDELKNGLNKKTDKEIIDKIKEIVPSYVHTENNGFSSLKEKRILITGDKGFIGTNLKNKLNTLGLSWQAASLEEGKDLSIRSQVMELPPADIVFHLASNIPQKTNGGYEKDIETMKNIIEFCEMNNSVLIFPSSSAVYGDADDIVNENSVLNPINEYGKSKMYCERLFNESQINGAILRLFNVYGENQYEKFVIPSIIKGVKDGKITISLAKRDFVHISDVIEAMLKAAIICKDKKEILNIGSGESAELKHVADVIESLLNKQTIREYQNNLGNIKSIRADMEKTKRVLNWEPEIKLEDGLRRITTQII
jgi:FlaA1/EpsC-like NDP-sugar epimerase